MKESLIKSRYIAICKKIDSERDPICSGCGRWKGGDIILSHSHIISRPNCKGLSIPELIYNEFNIVFHCMDFGEHEGCHGKWECYRRIELLDYDANMTYIRNISEEIYQRILVE